MHYIRYGNSIFFNIYTVFVGNLFYRLSHKKISYAASVAVVQSRRDAERATHVGSFLILMYKTAVYTLVNGVVTHQKQQISKNDNTRHDIA